MATTKAAEKVQVQERGISLTDREFGGAATPEVVSTSEIQGKIDEVAGTIPIVHRGMANTKPVFIPEGVWLIDEPLLIYPGVTLYGTGPGSVIKAASGFTGDRLLQLMRAPGESSPQCSAVKLLDIKLDTTEAPDIWGIEDNDAEDTRLLLGEFRLYLNCAYGVKLSYAQTSKIWLYAHGSIERILQIGANDCEFWIDKEGDETAGATSHPYVEIEEHFASDSSSNDVRRCLIEGVVSASKTPLKISGGRNTRIGDFWYEPTASATYWCEIENSSGPTHFYGTVRIVGAGPKLSLSNAMTVTIDRFFGVGLADVGADEIADIDDSSHLHIRELLSYREADVFLLDTAGKLRIDKVFGGATQVRVEAGTIDGHSFVGTPHLHGPNLLVNPSFEAGEYQWGRSANGLFASAASRFGPGLMAEFTCAVDGPHWFSQNVTIPTEWVGLPLTLSALVEAEGGGYASLRVTGAGVTFDTQTPVRAMPGAGRQLLTRTFIPQSAGTLAVGITGVSMVAATSAFYLDDFCLVVGTDAVINPAKFGNTIDAGGRSILWAASTPPGGTWKVGDIVFNNTPSAGGTVGWVCTTAGTPGTWKTFGSIAA